jgi:dihydroorotase
MTDRLSLIRPDDWHLHVRDGAAMADVIKDTAAPLRPRHRHAQPEAAGDHRRAAGRLSRAHPGRPAEPACKFEPLMTLYLTDNTAPAEIAAAKASGFVHAVKYYPAGATTNSEPASPLLAAGAATLAAMEQHGLPLLVHGEVTDSDGRRVRPRARCSSNAT